MGATPMKTLLAAALALVVLAAPASARESGIPAIYFGQWCGDVRLQDNATTFDHRYHLADRPHPGLPNDPQCEETGAITLDRDGLTTPFMHCRWTAVRRTGERAARSTKATPGLWPKGDYVPVLLVRGQCTFAHTPRVSEPIWFRLEWVKGDLLTIYNVTVGG
jgi:hypothetical protein